jgi:hypothetical protein
MPFPVSLNGAVFSELDTIEATLERAEAVLRDQRAKTVDREGTDGLRFQGSFLNRRWGGSVLTVVSWGRLRVSRSESLIRVDYHLGFVQNILVRGAVAAAAFGFIYFGVPAGNSSRTLMAGFAFWLLLAALDYWLAAWLFPRYLASELRKDDETALES